MIALAWALLLAPIALALYAYAGYPLALRALARRPPRRPRDRAADRAVKTAGTGIGAAAAMDAPRARPAETARTDAPAGPAAPEDWPFISISLPAYNERSQIAAALDGLLRLDYPADRRQILVVSDASDDGTDDIVARYADRGVELLRLPARAGKTAAEAAAAPRLRGEIVVNTDASVRIRPDALRPLIARFRDPSVGVASGRDVSIGRDRGDANQGEARYVGYEMAVRALETRAGGIIGASGCFYAVRAELHRAPLPNHLSRDFAAALIARRHGYRAVSVDDAVCYVPRTGGLRREYRRKVRTITRGVQTLLHMRALLDPFRYGRFAWMLWSHKVCRWLVPVAATGALAGLAFLAPARPWAAWTLAAAAATIAAAAAGWLWPAGRTPPRILAIPAFALASNLAILHALGRTAFGDRDPVWEPTRRGAAAAT